MKPEIIVGYAEEGNNYYASFKYRTIEYGYVVGKTREEAVANLAQYLAERLARIIDNVY